jgi:UDP-N-acetylenolpyruvoylglucosamine reductase
MYSKADSFYKKLIQNIWFAEYKNDQIFISIKRWDFNTPEGKIKQLDDIDVTIDIEVNNRIYHYDISEKFRRDDYLDMFVELYSKYPNVEGWGVKSKANVIFYHTPNYLYIIDTNVFVNCPGIISKIDSKYKVVMSAKVIDELGLKGTKIGGAEISTKHTGFIINTHSATSHDVKQLISLIQEKVKSATNEDLTTEIEFVLY